ncbi:TPA: PTS sugar transporter subunit IIA [Providencia rettgeri]|uniref:PTS sugar transporter subunit IIA n=1 Tax=Providencia TaxID=586 RepID=UPI001B363DC7|nr:MULTISPECIES: PTS sugar transporter subunit IIA [Providencia]EMB5785405.1 PTS sugar transporter subunit IIA [Providencia rettgeri]MBQ0368410.1 PTS sugar transporter subunit IIA [Providencia rettgeri]MDK7745975.1 PTS sugar transporter subunit IIA [Providencia rettgeri]MDK7758421.1 PTS sugar transporter subunit IIA [Providencia rettgeri]HBC7430522.1 PTS sugar transporter subunit IIA [Providencia rettgeri]
MLTTLLTPNVIQVVDKASNWREAIKIACNPLINNNFIESRYVDAIIQSHEKIGPYYVLGPGIAMPHARPEDGVNQLSLGLTVLKQGVEFGSEGNDPIKLLIVLAATDSNSHIGAIAKLAELFDNQEDIDSIMQSENVDDILKIIAKYE